VQAIQGGNRDFSAIEAQATKNLTQRDWKVDYISVRSPSTLAVAKTEDRDLIVLGAARYGTTRLIDNIEF
jgi:pantoate--beta-alanine ligase